MKSVVVLSVAFLMLLKPMWPIAEYVINYDYITKNLCENIDRPVLECNGKCYLTKQLAKESKDTDENPFSNKQNYTEIQFVIFFQSFAVYTFEDISLVDICNNYNTTKTHYSHLFVCDIEPPPRIG